MGPATAAAELQITPPNTMAPCEIMITVAFMRPRAQLGIERCAATQSSEADNVHPTPASAATTKNSSAWRTNAINTYAATINKLAERVTESGEKRALSQEMTNTAPNTEPAPILVNKRPSWDAFRCKTCKPTTGINAGMTEIKRANRKFRAKTTWISGT